MPWVRNMLRAAYTKKVAVWCKRHCNLAVRVFIASCHWKAINRPPEGVRFILFCGTCFLTKEFKRNFFMWLFKQRASRNSQQPLRFHQRAFLLERIHLRGKSYLWMSLFNKGRGIHVPRTNSTMYAIKYSYSYFILDFSNQIQHWFKKKIPEFWVGNPANEMIPLKAWFVLCQVWTPYVTLKFFL